VNGTVYVQTGEWYREALYMGVAIGCLSAVLISVNNLRDVDEDRGNGKNTLAVKCGRRNTINLVRIMTATPYVIAMFMDDLGWKMLAFFPPFVLGLFIIKRICSEAPGARYNKYLALAALQLILFATAVTLVAIL